MATIEDVKKLASLARLTISDADLAKFSSEFEAILAYVGQLETLKIPTDCKEGKPALRNVMREDGEPQAAGKNTEKLIAQFPEREGTALVVKQIISHD